MTPKTSKKVMNDETRTLDTLVQETIEADTEFQDSLVDMSDEDKETAVTEKTVEVRELQFKTLGEESAKNKKDYEETKVRAEKAENSNKKEKKPAEKDDQPVIGTSLKDMRALNDAEVHEDDLEEVESYAKFKKISIAEALKDKTLKTILSEKTEERKTADATNTGKAKPGNKKVSGAELQKNLSEGKVPEKGSVEAETLYKARRGIVD